MHDGLSVPQVLVAEHLVMLHRGHVLLETQASGLAHLARGPHFVSPEQLADLVDWFPHAPLPFLLGSKPAAYPPVPARFCRNTYVLQDLEPCACLLQRLHAWQAAVRLKRIAFGWQWRHARRRDWEHKRRAGKRRRSAGAKQFPTAVVHLDAAIRVVEADAAARDAEGLPEVLAGDLRLLSVA